MAFTNPILAGEELNRTGIRSENYVAGQSGWRIANDGAAEFEDRVRAALQLGREFLEVGVQAHAQQGIARSPRSVEFLDECHGDAFN